MAGPLSLAPIRWGAAGTVISSPARMRRDAVRDAIVCLHEAHVLQVHFAEAVAAFMTRGAGHHVLLARGHAAVGLDEMS
eukprot:9590503-Heterocapsa_arctica.AAC.1